MDVDGDDDQDLFITGLDSADLPIAKLYINRVFSFNDPDISGICFYDINENQVRDSDEVELSNQIIQITPNANFSYPNLEGRYRFFVDTGAYQLTSIPIENWELTTQNTIDINYEAVPLTDINFGFIPTTEIQSVEPDLSSNVVNLRNVSKREREEIFTNSNF